MMGFAALYYTGYGLKWYGSFRTFIGYFNMLEFHKSIVVDENQKPVAVQIPFDEFQRIEEVIENFGLAKLMDETEEKLFLFEWYG